MAGDPRDEEADPTPRVRLDADQRAELYADLDLDALERLLARLPEDVRPGVLRFFRDWTHADPEAVLAAFPEIVPDGPPGARTFLLPFPEALSFDDPELEALLQAVLAKRSLW